MHQLQFLESSKWKCISKTLLLLILQTLCLFFVTYLFLTKFCHNFFLWQYIMKLLYLPFAWIISWMISSLPFSLIFFFWTHWMDWSFNFFSFLPYFSLCLLFPSLSHTQIYSDLIFQPFSWFLYFCFHVLYPCGFYFLIPRLLLSLYYPVIIPCMQCIPLSSWGYWCVAVWDVFLFSSSLFCFLFIHFSPYLLGKRLS